MYTIYILHNSLRHTIGRGPGRIEDPLMRIAVVIVTVVWFLAVRALDAFHHLDERHDEPGERQQHAERRQQNLVEVLPAQDLVVLQLQHAQCREDEGQWCRVHHALYM